jgi:hypothetical protein
VYNLAFLREHNVVSCSVTVTVASPLLRSIVTLLTEIDSNDDIILAICLDVIGD